MQSLRLLPQTYEESAINLLYAYRDNKLFSKTFCSDQINMRLGTADCYHFIGSECTWYLWSALLQLHLLLAAVDCAAHVLHAFGRKYCN